MQVPTKWEHVLLDEVCKTTSGGTPSRNRSDYYGGNIPWVKSGELEDSSICKTEETITEEAIRKSSAKIFPKGTLLIALYGATVGKLGILRIDAATNQAVCAIFPGEMVNRDYLYFYLLSQRSNLIEAGTGGAQSNISQEVIRGLAIPLPPLEEQRRIAAIARKCDRLRRTRRFTQQLSDTYLQSVFLKMFGDPAKNPMKWEIRKFRTISDKFSDGPFGSNLKSEHYERTGIRVFRLQNVGIGKLIDGDQAYISEQHFKSIEKHTCLPGDVIAGTLGDPNLRAFIIPKSIPIAINKADCVQIRPNLECASAEYICWLLNMPQTLQLAAGMILGETRERISMGRLAELNVPVPPLHLQERFAKVVQRFERLHIQQREADRQTEHLFQTVLHRAFRGEL